MKEIGNNQEEVETLKWWLWENFPIRFTSNEVTSKENEMEKSVLWNNSIREKWMKPIFVKKQQNTISPYSLLSLCASPDAWVYFTCSKISLESL